LQAVSAAPGLPCKDIVRRWARADGEFTEALRIARAQAEWLALRYDEAVAAEFLRRARAGETINDLLREPGMPSRRAYRHWQMTQAPFCEAIGALRQRRDQGIAERCRARYRDWDAGLGDRIILGVHRGGRLAEVLAGDPALPSLPIVRRWRREQPEFDAVLRMMIAAHRRVRGAAPGCTPAMTDKIVARIVMGGSFASVGREPGMPSRQTLRRWMRVRPEFAEAVAWACHHREDWYYEQITLIAEAATPGNLKAARRQMGPLLRHLVRLRHRPGAVHRKRAKGER
jgi:hypothetical protein